MPSGGNASTTENDPGLLPGMFESAGADFLSDCSGLRMACLADARIYRYPRKEGMAKSFIRKIPEGQPLPNPTVLVQKIEDTQIEEEVEKLRQLSLSQAKKEKKSAAAALPLPPLKETITIEDVKKLDLRVGVVRHAEPVPQKQETASPASRYRAGAANNRFRDRRELPPGRSHRKADHCCRQSAAGNPHGSAERRNAPCLKMRGRLQSIHAEKSPPGSEVS